MNGLVTLGVVILAGLLHAAAQLSLSCLTVLYHKSSGRHKKSKTRALTSSFLSGTGTMTLLALGVTCCIIDKPLGEIFAELGPAIVIGALASSAIVMWFFYYRPGKTTQLQIPTKVSRLIENRAKTTNSNTEAFTLGLFCQLVETPVLTTPLIVGAYTILSSEPKYQIILFPLYTVAAIAPLIILRLTIKTGRTAVDIQKWRVRNKNFIRIISGFSFLALAIFILTFGQI